MAEVLEAMGFPSEWCERALKSASGLETAVDLLLHWQAQVMPQYLPSFVRPLSPRPPSSGQNVLHLQQANPGSPPTGVPILRLQPLPSRVSKTLGDQKDQSLSSTLLPSTSSPCPSSVEGQSRANLPSDSGCPSSSSPGYGDVRLHPFAQAENNSPAYRIVTTGDFVVESASRDTGRSAGPSRPSFSLDSSDAVVPDAYAEEHKARYAAAQRAKQEKQHGKTRIRQHMQEDVAHRRLRHSIQFPFKIERTILNFETVRQRRDRLSCGLTMDTAVELQIRFPGSQILKASFTAGDTLKKVKAYVEHQLQQPRWVLGFQDHYSSQRAGSVPFTWQSAYLLSGRQAERELLQGAQENVEFHTGRRLASGSHHNDFGMSQGTKGGNMSFIIPFPRQEFFTESSMETTLAEAQLVPRGTLVVQYRQGELEPKPSGHVHSEKTNVSDSNLHLGSRLVSAEVPTVDENVQCKLIEVAYDSNKAVRVQDFEKGNSSFRVAETDTMKSGRILEMEGERVRVRERALQAAAKRMTEAARIFRAGLPLTEGETGEAFHFPRDVENQNVDNNVLFRNPSSQEVVPVVAAPLPVDNESVGLIAGGVNAEMLGVGNLTDEHPLSQGRLHTWSPNRSIESLHQHAVASAEGHMRNLQPHVTAFEGGCKQEPEEAESRIGENDVKPHMFRAKVRIPQSSRLLLRPEKLQRLSNDLSLNYHPVSCNVEWQMRGESKRHQHPRLSMPAASLAGPLEAALQRCNATIEGDSKGKAILEEHVPPLVIVPSSSVQVEAVRNSCLRAHLEDGNVVLHTFPTSKNQDLKQFEIQLYQKALLFPFQSHILSKEMTCPLLLKKLDLFLEGQLISESWVPEA